MKPQTDFETRVAQIQARAAGKLPPKPIIAPLVDEHLAPPKKRRRGLRMMILLVLATAVAGGFYSAELVSFLPQDVVASSEFLTSIANGDLLRAGL